MNILLCTLGQTWAVIPESFGLLDPTRCSIYRDHPGHAAIEGLRRKHELRPVDELWVCTTDDTQLDEGLKKLERWCDLIAPDLPLRVWRTAEVADVADQVAGDQVRELIYRAVLLASEHTGREGHLYLSLAGGRKTMSADLQRAGMLIGCSALLHVIAPPFNQMSEPMRQAAPDTFTRPLSLDDCKGLVPLVVGAGKRSELLDIEESGQPRLTAANYPLPEAGDAFTWRATEPSLPREIERREREGSRLLGNYLQLLAGGEHHDNWRSLYRLPPALIERLRHTRLTEVAPEALRRLPKADLHRHIGGCLDIAAQRRVGRAIWDSLSERERALALDRVRPLLANRAWDWEWPRQLKAGERAHNAAALLMEADDEQLQYNLFEVTRPRHGLQKSGQGFAAYERPGELAGSAVLGHPAALQTYLHALLQAARHEGLHYLELRGSPQKYRRDHEAQIDFLRQLQAIAREYSDITLRFIVIADRRQADRLEAVVQLTVEAREALDGFVVGLDLAGDEMQDGTHAPLEIARHFEPAFRACLPITIHAGEGTPSDKIWEAAYRLHADRIGHGLTLSDDHKLLQRFRDRGICIELCPSSNDEVVGYGDDKPYPLQHYWREGVPLALCTDNPGISRTDATGELLKAAEYWPGLSLWEAMAIVKQGFAQAFLPVDERDQLLKTVDREVYNWVLERTKALVSR